MRFMLMMHAPRGNTGDYQVASWKPEELRAHIGFMHSLNQELTKNGELVDVQGLDTPGAARVVRAGKNGSPAVTDGPFPETKEFLAGSGSSTSIARSAPTRSPRKCQPHPDRAEHR